MLPNDRRSGASKNSSRRAVARRAQLTERLTHDGMSVKSPRLATGLTVVTR